LPRWAWLLCSAYIYIDTHTSYGRPTELTVWIGFDHDEGSWRIEDYYESWTAKFIFQEL